MNTMADYVRLGDVQTWYDVQGKGEPLVLLHGGLVDSRTFDPAVPRFSDRFTVYTVDRRGHGRTPDVEGPISYELMAADTVAFLERVVRHRKGAHLVGYSDGGIVALLVALRRPDLVGKLVLISANYHFDGVRPEMMAGFTLTDMVEQLGPSYAEVSPDGAAHYPEVVAKLVRMMTTEPTLTEADLAPVASPTLVMAGDDDAVRLEHTISLYRGIPDSELAIVPGTSHLLVLEKPDLIWSTVREFLTTDPVATIAPIRRAGAG